MSSYNFMPSPSHGAGLSPAVHNITPRLASDFFPPQQQQQYAALFPQSQSQQFLLDDAFPFNRTPLHFRGDPQPSVNFDTDFSVRPSVMPADLSSPSASSTSSPSISFHDDSAGSSPVIVPQQSMSPAAPVATETKVQTATSNAKRSDKPKNKRRGNKKNQGDDNSAHESDGSSKKKRVALTKCACVPCRKFKAACDSSRPCARCIRLNRADQCIDYVPRPRGGARIRVKKEPVAPISAPAPVPAATSSPGPAPASVPSRLSTPPSVTERPYDHQSTSPGSSGSSTASSPPRPSPEPLAVPQFSVINPTNSGTMFQAAGFLNTLLPTHAPPLPPNDSLQGEWNKELPAPTATPITELMWLEDENLFSVLEQFDKEAHSSSQKNEKLLLAMAWILCDIIIFSGCFRRSHSSSTNRPHPRTLSSKPSILSICDESQPLKAAPVPAPTASLFLQQNPSMCFSLPQSVFNNPDVRSSLLPLFRSLASPDLERREKLWTFLNSWKHEADVQSTLQMMATPYTAEAIEAMYHSELLKSSFLPFGVVLCPLNPYFRTFPFYVNQRMHTMMGYTPEDAAELTTSCPFHRMAVRSSLSKIKKLVYEAIRYSRTDFTLPMVLTNKFNQAVPVVVSSKFKFHGAIPVLGIFYVQFANQPIPRISAS